MRRPRISSEHVGESDEVAFCYRTSTTGFKPTTNGAKHSRRLDRYRDAPKESKIATPLRVYRHDDGNVSYETMKSVVL
jgi:hypothetical protein